MYLDHVVDRFRDRDRVAARGGNSIRDAASAEVDHSVGAPRGSPTISDDRDRKPALERERADRPVGGESDREAVRGDDRRCRSHRARQSHGLQILEPASPELRASARCFTDVDDHLTVRRKGDVDARARGYEPLTLPGRDVEAGDGTGSPGAEAPRSTRR